MRKEKLVEFIDRNYEEMVRRGRQLFATPELGFFEEATGKLITSFFDDFDIDYETSISRTGIKVTIGSGDAYHIGVLADMDAMLVDGPDGPMKIHSCGHSAQVSMVLALALAFSQSGVIDKTDAKVTFLFTPAEEYICLEDRKSLVKEDEIKYLSGKQDMIAQGLFDDMDCILSAHMNGEEGRHFDVNSTLVGFTRKEVRFHGKATHSGATPHLGLNALHGANLAITALSYIKDQFAPEDGIKLYPILTKGGMVPNIIPEEAVLESDLRATNTEALLRLTSKFDTCVTACAKALGLTCDIEQTVGYMPLKQSEEINQLVFENMKLYMEEKDIIHNVLSGAAGDVGDLGYLLPTIQFGFSGMRGRFHSSDFEIIDEEFVYKDAVKVMAGTLYDLIMNPSSRVKKDGYKERKDFYLKNWLQQESE